MDSICITMPQSPRAFFLAMPVIQDYLYQYIQEVKHGMRDGSFHITFRMNEEFSGYELPLKVAKDINPTFDYTGWTVKNRSEFTCFIDFDFQAAERISRTTGKHITETLGILIGSTPKKQPILPPVLEALQEGRILVVNWDGSRIMEQALKLSTHFEGGDAINLREPISMEDVDILEVGRCEGIIGPASVLTHLAATYNRKVVEIFPDVMSYRLYNNENIPAYQAVIAEPYAIGAELLISAWNNLHQVNFDLVNVRDME